MKREPNLGEVQQNSLRWVIGGTIALTAFVLVAFAFRIMPLVTVLASLCGVGMSYWSLFHTCGHPRNWWFLWKGPVLMADWETPEGLAEIEAWVDALPPESYHRVIPGCYKFRNKSTAVHFKLVFS